MNNIVFSTHENSPFFGSLLTLLDISTVAVFLATIFIWLQRINKTACAIYVFALGIAVVASQNFLVSKIKSPFDGSPAIYAQTVLSNNYIPLKDFNREMESKAKLRFSIAPDSLMSTSYDVTNLRTKQKYYDCSLRFSPVTKNKVKLDAVICGNNILPK